MVAHKDVVREVKAFIARMKTPEMLTPNVIDDAITSLWVEVLGNDYEWVGPKNDRIRQWLSHHYLLARKI